MYQVKLNVYEDGEWFEEQVVPYPFTDEKQVIRQFVDANGYTLTSKGKIYKNFGNGTEVKGIYEKIKDEETLKN